MGSNIILECFEQYLIQYSNWFIMNEQVSAKRKLKLTPASAELGRAQPQLVFQNADTHLLKVLLSGR